MKQMNLLIVIMSLLMACNSDDVEIEEMIEEPQESQVSYTTLLAGTESKSWKIASSSLDDEADVEESCKSSSPRSEDNTFIFFTNGDLEYDFGDVTTSDDGGCNDPSDNIIGEWYFSSDSSMLNIKILHFKNDPDYTFNEEASNITIISLTADTLKTREPQYDGSFNEVIYVKR